MVKYAVDKFNDTMLELYQALYMISASFCKHKTKNLDKTKQNKHALLKNSCENKTRSLYVNIIRYRFDDPCDVFEVHFLIKACFG